MLPILAAVAAVGAATVYTQVILPSSIDQYGMQFQETHKRGILLSTNRAQYAVWSPDANLPFEQPRQDLLPGQVTDTERSYATDVTNMQTGQIEFNLRRRNGRVPLQSAGYTPLLVKTLNASKTLSVKGGDTLAGNPMTTAQRNNVGDLYPTAPDIARSSGWSDDYDNSNKTAIVYSNLVTRRNPWAAGGQYVQLTSRNDNPITQTGQLPKVSYLDPTNGDRSTRGTISIQK